MLNPFNGLAVVIPTRNRANLAQNAIRSVLSQKNCELQLFVSDNSDDITEIDQLKTFCSHLDDPRLHYINPSQSLPMSGHWNWAMQQVLHQSNVNHFIYLTDRMIFHPDSLREISEIVIRFPDDTLVYPFDGIQDRDIPVILYQSAYSGHVYKVNSDSMLNILASRMLYVTALPRMLNCCVPRTAIQAVTNKMGQTFSSVSPDYNFAFAHLAIVASILFYDKPILLSYGVSRSQGSNTMKGIIARDTKDFFEMLGDTPLSFETPVPAFFCAINAVLHEYFYVKKIFGEDKFPEIDQQTYSRHLMANITSFENSQMKQKLLKEYYKNVGLKSFYYQFRAKFPIRTLVNNFAQITYDNQQSEKAFMLTKKFPTVEEAIDFAINFPREPIENEKFVSIKTGDSFERIELR